MRDCGCNSHGSFLTAKGLEEAAKRDPEFDFNYEVVLTRDAQGVRLDKSGSVSDSGPGELLWDSEIIEEQHRRFHNGS